MLCYSHFATLANAVQLEEFSLQMEDMMEDMNMLLIAIRLISLEVVKLETANILNLDQNQRLPEMSPYPIMTGSEESGSKLDRQMIPSSNALLMVGQMVTTPFQMRTMYLNIKNLVVVTKVSTIWGMYLKAMSAK